MKASSAVCVISLAASAAAQQPTNGDEQQIWQAYTKLQQEPSFQLDLAGTETIYGVSRRFSSTLYFATSTDPRTGQPSQAKVELDDYDTTGSQPVLINRYVGDGKTLWSYDVLHQRYSSSFYSWYGSRAPAQYVGSDAPRMLAELYAAARSSNSAYLVRMLREINPGPSTLESRYETWAPGETPGEPPLSPTTPDPLVPTRFYSSSSGEQWILYGPYDRRADGSYRTPDRSVAFKLDDISGQSSSPDWRLTGVFFADKGANRFTDWSITVTDPSLTVPAWAFVPYKQNFTQGWMPLSGPRPYSG